MKKENKLSLVWLSFVIYLVLFLVICRFVENTQLTWLLLSGYSLFASLVLLKKYKMPNKKAVIVAVFLSALYVLSELEYFGLYSAISIVLVFIGVCSVIATFENEKDYAIYFLKSRRTKDILI